MDVGVAEMSKSLETTKNLHPVLRRSPEITVTCAEPIIKSPDPVLKTQGTQKIPAQIPNWSDVRRSSRPTMSSPSNNQPRRETIVFVGPRGHIDAKLSPNHGGKYPPSMSAHPLNNPPVLVCLQSGMSMCVFVLLSCVAVTVFVLLLTQTTGNERLPCGGGPSAQVA